MVFGIPEIEPRVAAHYPLYYLSGPPNMAVFKTEREARNSMYSGGVLCLVKNWGWRIFNEEENGY